MFQNAINGEVSANNLPNGDTISIAGNADVETGATGQNIEPLLRQDPFLPETVLREGAQGPSVRVLRDRLQYLYEIGFISVPAAPTIEAILAYKYDTAGMQRLIRETNVWRALEAYIDQGRSYKGNRTSPLLQRRSSAGNYVVDRLVWESLGLTVGNTWERMFGPIDAGGDTIHMRLQHNLATITWRPKFWITHGKQGRNDCGVLSPDDPLYQSIVRESLSRVLRWSSTHGSNRVGRRGSSWPLEIQGIPGQFIVLIRDVNGQLYDPERPIISYNFLARTQHSSNVYIPIKTSASHAWVFDATAWSYNRRLRMTIYQHPDNFRVNSEEQGRIDELENEIDRFEREIRSLRTMGGKAPDGWLESTLIELQMRLGDRRSALQAVEAAVERRIQRRVEWLAVIVEHEFGHVCGLFDQYDYGANQFLENEDHNWFQERASAILRNALTVAFPGVPPSLRRLDQYVGPNSIMQRTNWEAHRTAQDYEMVLFAFRDNALQNYVEQNPAEAARMLAGRVLPPVASISPGLPLAAGAAALLSTPLTAPMIQSLTPKSQVFYHYERYRYE